MRERHLAISRDLHLIPTFLFGVSKRKGGETATPREKCVASPPADFFLQSRECASVPTEVSNAGAIGRERRLL